jgi:tRNA 2-thiocytidine biosynthesis protein TtcA
VERSKAYRNLMRNVAQLSRRFDLLQPGDRIMVAISGGKDSYSLLTLLHETRRKLPFELDLVAVHLDQGQPGYDGRAMKAWLDARGYEHRIRREDTYSVVTAHLEPTQTYCSLCSRLRRGVLYGEAAALGCNKIALGHHRNDALETFLLNLFFAGKLQAMPPKYRTDDGRFEVIRPLLEADETDIVTFADEQGYPIIPCNLCGSQENLKRKRMGQLLEQLESMNPHVRSVMMNALGNVATSHLLDPRLHGLGIRAGRQDRLRVVDPSSTPSTTDGAAATGNGGGIG